MKKRNLKKIKKRKSNHYSLYAEGNNGGDVIKIIDNHDGTIYLFSGHCCVVDVQCIVPVEFLTAIINDVMLNNDCNVKKVIDSFKWDESFKTELKLKVNENGSRKAI